MKANPSLQDILALLDSQRVKIERLESQVTGLTVAKEDKVNDNVIENNNSHVKTKENVPIDHQASFDKRLQDLEDVVTDLKGEMMELMFVYQDVQDKLFDIDRFVSIFVCRLNLSKSERSVACFMFYIIILYFTWICITTKYMSFLMPTFCVKYQ